MQDEKPPFDLRSFLKRQRSHAETLLYEVSQTESHMESDPKLSRRMSTASATSGGFFVGIIVSIAVLAGFLVLRPPPPPSPIETMLRKELAEQKDHYERQISELTATILTNQADLVHTQDALRANEQELINVQKALANIEHGK
jgi:hypothetical protein